MKSKAVVFYTYLPPWRVDVFNAMAKYFDLTVVFLFPGAEGFTYDRQFLSGKLTVPHVFWENGFNIGNKPFRFGIVGLLNRLQPEVVFSHEYSPTSILLTLLKKFKYFSFKLIITTSDNLLMVDSVSFLKKHIRRFILAQSHGIIVYSKSVQDWYLENFKGLRVEVCPNIQKEDTLLEYRSDFNKIIDDHSKKFDLFNNRIVLYVGRLNAVKGLDLLLRAFAEVKNVNYKLVLVGEGHQKAELMKLAESLNLTDQVIFAGFYSSADLYAWYAMSDFMVLPSRYEPFGAVVNEALVFGCPVLASKYIGALDYIKSTFNGIVFDPLNHDEFVKSLSQAMLLYHEFNYERKNLMIRSFDQYIESFIKITL